MPKWSDRPLRNVIADELRSRIMSGEYEPGTRIREEQVAADFGVSRVPVREALQLLEQQRFIVLRPRRGAIVDSPSPAGARELMAIRLELEGMAARLAAARRGGDQAGELTRVVETAEAALTSGEHDDLPDLIDEFHELVAMASGNEELVDMLRTIRSRVDWLFEVDIEERSPGSWTDHRRICDAIIGGDEVTASELMTSHVFKDEQLYDRISPSAHQH
ncbi:GntR family transcriptional regulator [soil metagenome]